MLPAYRLFRRAAKKRRLGLSDKIVCVVDLSAGMAALTEQQLPQEACPDSFNILPALVGAEGAEGHDHLVEQGRGLALRVGDWKLLEHPNAKPMKSLTYEKGPGQFELYNLAEEPGETNNLIAQHPQRVEQMKSRLNAIRAAGPRTRLVLLQRLAKHLRPRFEL